MGSWNFPTTPLLKLILLGKLIHSLEKNGNIVAVKWHKIQDDGEGCERNFVLIHVGKPALRDFRPGFAKPSSAPTPLSASFPRYSRSRSISHHSPPPLSLSGPIFSIFPPVMGNDFGRKHSRKGLALPWLLSARPGHFPPVQNTRIITKSPEIAH